MLRLVRTFSTGQKARLNLAASITTKSLTFWASHSRILQRRLHFTDTTHGLGNSDLKHQLKEFSHAVYEGNGISDQMQGIGQLALDKDQVLKGTFVGGMYREEEPFAKADGQARRHKVALMKGIEQGKAHLIVLITFFC